MKHWGARLSYNGQEWGPRWGDSENPVHIAECQQFCNTGWAMDFFKFIYVQHSCLLSKGHPDLSAD